MKFGIVIVVYHSFERIIKYVQQELPKFGGDCYSVIVDNDASTEESCKLAATCGAVLCNPVQKITDIDARLFLINSQENLGYARGNNLGVKFLRMNFDVDYLLFSNDDIVIKSENILPKLANKLRNNPSCKMIGPRVVGTDGIDQSPHHRVISIYRQIGWNLFPFLRGHCNIRDAKQKYEESLCYWVSGAFMMVEANAFEKCSGFDENTFLYYEEVILAERLLKHGYKAFWTPDAMVVHEGAASTPSSEFAKKELLKSACYYYQAYCNISTFLISFYKLSLAWNSFWKK